MKEKLQHLAIIMDGNGRWAKKQGKARTFGHLRGSDRVRDIALKAKSLGIKVLTLYAFSSENWKRSALEVDYLMKLPISFFDKYIDELKENDVQIRTIGDLTQLPPNTKAAIERAVAETAANSSMILNFALNYGSRAELTRAAAKIAQLARSDYDFIVTEESFADQLETASLPPVDLLIRTGGEKRLSNFLLYQLAYSELIFIDEYWPDFNGQLLSRCLEEYAGRQRRYGGLDDD